MMNAYEDSNYIFSPKVSAAHIKWNSEICSYIFLLAEGLQMHIEETVLLANYLVSSHSNFATKESIFKSQEEI